MYPSILFIITLLTNVSVIDDKRKMIIMDKLNRQVESRRDFRYGLYFKDVPNGLGDNFVSIMKQKKKERDKELNANHSCVTI